MEVFAEEEKSADREATHFGEAVGYMMFSEEGLLRLEGAGSNRPPRAQGDRFVLDEDTVENSLNLLLDHGMGPDEDPDQDPLYLEVVGQPSQGGTVRLHDKPLQQEGRGLVLYTPRRDFIGTETFTYTVSDGLLKDSAVVTLTVENSDNDAPDARDDSFRVLEGAQDLVLAVLGSQGNGPDLDPDADRLNIVHVGRPDQGGQVFVTRPTQEGQDVLVYTPSTGFNGKRSLYVYR